VSEPADLSGVEAVRVWLERLDTRLAELGDQLAVVLARLEKVEGELAGLRRLEGLRATATVTDQSLKGG
jgi:hypothetical protein